MSRRSFPGERPRKGAIGDKTEILFGFHPVMEALRAGRRRFSRLLVADTGGAGRSAELLALAESVRVPVVKPQPGQLDGLIPGFVHQGVAAIVSPLPLWDMKRMSQSIDRESGQAFWVAVDGVQDPQNLGAIVRTALCAGAGGLIIPGNRAAGPTPTVSKVSAGALEHLPVVRVTNLVRALDMMKKNGFWIFGMAGSGDTSVFDADLTGRVALVLGGEEKGMHRLVADTCDGILRIPQMGPVASLNASAAAAVAIFEARRQRLNGTPVNREEKR